MAKRKRLTPANTGFLEDTHASPSPMISAPIADVAEEASSAAALEEMAHELHQARVQGRMIVSLPLDSIQAEYLVRDRVVVDIEGMKALKQSLRRRGQQAPIEVEALGDDSYGLISGWRRFQALRELQNEAGQGEGFDTVLALLRSPENSSDAYLSMVEENEIRMGLSFFERARIAVQAAKAGVFESETAALRSLYHAVPRAKRSKIKSFIGIVHALDDVLEYPEGISEKVGLKLAKRLEADPSLGAKLRSRVREAHKSGGVKDAESELACIQRDIPKTQGVLKSSEAGTSSGERGGRSMSGGIQLNSNPDGSLTLHGPLLNEDFRDRLIRWLSRQKM